MFNFVNNIDKYKIVQIKVVLRLVCSTGHRTTPVKIQSRFSCSLFSPVNANIFFAVSTCAAAFFLSRRVHSLKPAELHAGCDTMK